MSNNTNSASVIVAGPTGVRI